MIPRKPIALVVLWSNGAVMAFAADGTYALSPQDGPVTRGLINLYMNDHKNDPGPRWELWLTGCPDPIVLTRQQWLILEGMLPSGT